MHKIVLLGLLLLALPACADTPPAPPAAPPGAGATACTAPRPQICTRDYRPVCATRSDGIRRTYGNACTACADPAVLSHVPGACEGERP